MMSIRMILACSTFSTKKRRGGLRERPSRQLRHGNRRHRGRELLDLFASSRDKLGKWSEPVKLPPAINTPAHQGAMLVGRPALFFEPGRSTKAGFGASAQPDFHLH